MLLDSDGDGLFDVVDIDNNPGSSDIDGDGIIDEADIDFVNGGADTDFDGIADASDPDADGNGLVDTAVGQFILCLLYTSPSPRDATLSRMPSSA